MPKTSAPTGWHVNKQAHVVSDADGGFVCDLNHVPGWAIPLIIAAPDMHDALRLAWNSIDRVNHPAAAAIKSALEKTEGCP